MEVKTIGITELIEKVGQRFPGKTISRRLINRRLDSLLCKDPSKLQSLGIYKNVTGWQIPPAEIDNGMFRRKEKHD